MLGTKILEERKSKFNGNLRVLKTLGLGTYIQANDLTQSGGVVKSIWSQTLKKLKTREIKKVLILGLGGGTAVKLIKNFWPQSKIIGVEIDPVMIELGKKYLGLDTFQVKIQLQDAYTLNSSGYDLVLVDLYNGDQFPEKFEKEEFLKGLTKNKLVIFNRLYYGDKRSDTVRFGKKLERVFTRVDYFYPEANLMFLCYNN
jgi:spermidine synthase